MAEPVSIVLAGLGGYGEMYLAAMLDERNRRQFRLVGAVDPAPQDCSRLDELQRRGVPVYPSLEDFYQANRADLTVVSSPIHRHCAQTCLALSHGSHVLCEKPPAATVQEVDRMIEARNQAGKWVAIGYQWSFSTPVQQLKRHIRSGLFGRARRMKSLCLWPRTEAYYRRNDWAGRMHDEHGEWILDSPLNNAMAHDLHNMLYLLGDATDTSARPGEVVTEMYRANEIQNCDTVVSRVHTLGGAEILFYGSHAAMDDFGPVFSFEFERARIDFAGGKANIVARLENETVKHYASPDSEPHSRKLWTCVSAVAAGDDIPCGLEAARAQTVCTNGAQDSAGSPVPFPRSLVQVKEKPDTRLIWVAGLADTLRRCYADGVLPSEMGISWARPGRSVDLSCYHWYPGGRR